MAYSRRSIIKMGVGSGKACAHSFCCEKGLFPVAPNANNTYTVPRALSAQVANCM